MSEKGELVRRLFKAVEQRDVDAVIACYADDVEIHEAESLPYGGVYRGRDAGLRHWKAVMGAWAPFKTGLAPDLDATFIDGEGDTVAVLFRARAIDASQRLFVAPEVGIYTVRDGAIVRSQMFHADGAAVARFLRVPRTSEASGQPARGVDYEAES
jgi:uncharacterized protein